MGRGRSRRYEGQTILCAVDVQCRDSISSPSFANRWGAIHAARASGLCTWSPLIRHRIEITGDRRWMRQGFASASSSSETWICTTLDRLERINTNERLALERAPNGCRWKREVGCDLTRRGVSEDCHVCVGGGRCRDGDGDWDWDGTEWRCR